MCTNDRDDEESRKDGASLIFESGFCVEVFLCEGERALKHCVEYPWELTLPLNDIGSKCSCIASI